MHDPTYFDQGMALGFVHRRIFGGIRGALTGGITGAAAGFISPGGGGGSEGQSGSAVVPSAVGDSTPGLTLADPGRSRLERCPPGSVRDTFGRCGRSGRAEVTSAPIQVGPLGIDPFAILPGGDPFITIDRTTDRVPMIGLTATSPLRDQQVVRRCPGKGRVLGADALCYDRKSIRADQRMWPPGRKPLLTGGDLNAISRAARAAGRMKTQQKRLQKLGLLPKPKTQRRLTSGPTEHHHHA